MPNSKLFNECLVLASTLLCIVGYTITNKKAIWKKLYFGEYICGNMVISYKQRTFCIGNWEMTLLYHYFISFSKFYRHKNKNRLIIPRSHKHLFPV